MRDQAENVVRLIEEEVAFQERMEAEASEMATRLIQGYLGPDHKVVDMVSFQLSQALKNAREQGQADHAENVFSLG